VAKHILSFNFIFHGLKQGDASLPLSFSFTLEYVIGSAQEIKEGLKLNGTHQALVFADEQERKCHKEKHGSSIGLLTSYEGHCSMELLMFRI
jgi:hypothetical protein